MGSLLSKFSAAVLPGKFQALVSSLLIAILLIPGEAWAAPKPLDAATVHAKIEKRGLDRWVGVEINSGVALVGRIIGINADSFTLQLPNDPQPVTVNYADVIDLRTGPARGYWIFTGAAIGATVGFGIWAAVHFHHVEQQEQQQFPQPLP